MRILLLSTENSVTERITAFCNTANLDVFHYQDFINGLGNLDKLTPGIIICNASDFPRQWKALAAFIQADQALAKKITPAIGIFAENPLPAKEVQKAETLGIRVLNPDESEIIAFITAKMDGISFFQGDSNAIPQDEPGGEPGPLSPLAALVILEAPRRIRIYEVESIGTQELSLKNSTELHNQGKETTLYITAMEEDDPWDGRGLTVVPAKKKPDTFYVLE